MRAWTEAARGSSRRPALGRRREAAGAFPDGDRSSRGGRRRGAHEELEAASLLVRALARGESFGTASTRAFSCASPIVASDIEGYAEVADHDETGILFRRATPRRSSARWSNSSRTRSAAEPTGAAAREAAEPYSGDRISAAALSIYDRLAVRQRRPGRRHEATDKAAAESVLAPGHRSVPDRLFVGLPVLRGPDPGPVERAFCVNEWKWVAVVVLVTLFSVVVRAYAGTLSSSRPIPSLWLCGAALSLRVPRLAAWDQLRRRPRRELAARPWATGTFVVGRVLATIVGVVFAYRLFDVVVVLALVFLTVDIASIPERALLVLAVALGIGLGIAARGFPDGAPRPPGPLSQEVGAVRPMVHRRAAVSTVLRWLGSQSRRFFFQRPGFGRGASCCVHHAPAFGIDGSVEAAASSS